MWPTGIPLMVHYNAIEGMSLMKPIRKMLTKCNLNPLVTWMIFESQAMVTTHPRCGPPLPPSEAGRVVAGNGDAPFSALLSCSTSHPQKTSLHLLSLSSPHSFIPLFIFLSCFPGLPHCYKHAFSNFESLKKLGGTPS